MRKTLLFIGFILFYGLMGTAQQSYRIVSLAASITHNLTELGAQQLIVGCTRHCITDPANKIPVVADAINVNMEKIALLKPDVVIASGLTKPQTLEALRKMGIRTIRCTQPRNFKELCNQFVLLGELCGKKEEAQQSVVRCEERMNTLKEKLSQATKPTVFMEIGSNPLYTALPNTFMGDYIVQAGGENISAQLTNGNISKEFVLMQNPDVIIVTAMGITGEDEKREWLKMKFLKSVQNNKVFTLPDEVCSPTPTSFVNTVEQLGEMLKSGAKVGHKK